MFHHLDAQQKLVATVEWIDTHWKVAIGGEVVPDCCDTIEEAYSVAEREILRKFPKHTCDSCRPWHPYDGQAN